MAYCRNGSKGEHLGREAPAGPDLLIRNIQVATMADTGEPYGAVRDGLVVVADGRIVWVGPEGAAPPEVVARARRTVDGEGGWVTPGLIDCHTHLVFAGTRANEFEMRLQGMTYEEIAQAGGGIRSTVATTRGASSEELYQMSATRLQSLAAHGVTTVEIKSGYGLDTETELRMLRVARNLSERLPVRVSPTLLAAHALPPEYAGRREAYLDLVCHEMIPRAAATGLAHAVDAFCEGIAFTLWNARASSMRPRPTGCRCACTPTSSPPSVAPSSQPATTPAPPTTWSMHRKRGAARSPRPGPLRYCSRARSTS